MICVLEIKGRCQTCAHEPTQNEAIVIEARKCDSCGRVAGRENELRIKGYGAWLLGTDIDMCFDCFSTWYDGHTDPAEVRRIVLSKAGVQ
jgi:hypothetical protein